MAFKNTNDYLSGRKPTVYPSGSEVVAVRYPLALVAADMDLNDAGAVGILPAGCVPVALYVDSDDLDTGTPAVALSVGLMNSGDTDVSTAWGTGLTVAQAGGQVQVLDKGMARMQATNADRKIGVKFTTAPATAAAGEIGITLLYRAA